MSLETRNVFIESTATDLHKVTSPMFIKCLFVFFRTVVCDVAIKHY